MTRPVGRHAVYVGQIPDAQGDTLRLWWPQSITDVPPRLDNVELLQSGLTLCQAAALLRRHNSVQKARGISDGRWAILAFCPKEGAA